MLKNFIFAVQSQIGTADRLVGMKNYLDKPMSGEDILVIISISLIAAGFILLIISAYIAQRKKMKK